MIDESYKIFTSLDLYASIFELIDRNDLRYLLIPVYSYLKN